MSICKYCNNEYAKLGIQTHERFCNKNPDKQEKSQAWKDAMQRNRGGNGSNQWTKAKETGIPYVLSDETRKKFIDAGTGRKLSNETKRKISLARKQYLEENPDMVPYKLNHYSKGPSYPETYWQGILDANGIDYIQEYRVGLYSLDFALIDKNIDLEIDGSQHYMDSRIVESDIRRTQFLEDQGWTVLRIRWSEYQSLSREEKETFVKGILKQLVGG